MPLRSVKMNRFILGFHRRVWCPKWTPVSSSSFMVTTAIVGTCTFLSPACGDEPGCCGPRVAGHPDVRCGCPPVRVGPSAWPAGAACGARAACGLSADVRSRRGICPRRATSVAQPGRRDRGRGRRLARAADRPSSRGPPAVPRRRSCPQASLRYGPAAVSRGRIDAHAAAPRHRRRRLALGASRRSSPPPQGRRHPTRSWRWPLRRRAGRRPPVRAAAGPGPPGTAGSTSPAAPESPVLAAGAGRGQLRRLRRRAPVWSPCGTPTGCARRTSRCCPRSTRARRGGRRPARPPDARPRRLRAGRCACTGGCCAGRPTSTRSRCSAAGRSGCCRCPPSTASAWPPRREVGRRGRTSAHALDVARFPETGTPATSTAAAASAVRPRASGGDVARFPADRDASHIDAGAAARAAGRVGTVAWSGGAGVSRPAVVVRGLGHRCGRRSGRLAASTPSDCG